MEDGNLRIAFGVEHLQEQLFLFYLFYIIVNLFYIIVNLRVNADLMLLF